VTSAAILCAIDEYIGEHHAGLANLIRVLYTLYVL